MEDQVGVPERESDTTVQDCEKVGWEVAARRMRDPEGWLVFGGGRGGWGVLMERRGERRKMGEREGKEGGRGKREGGDGVYIPRNPVPPQTTSFFFGTGDIDALI